ncbi:MAG: hypothetical protein QXY87_13330 [Saccharolobus sp.]|uniref:hypothetical protein n=1 Tax=Saccharolobus TaxID=2100760 RepID=UPI001F0CEB48|nr:hypothetical protein [Saccharolobus shibatae]MCH4816634.1 hypothetical protein [Saccharolobus shibatae]
MQEYEKLSNQFRRSSVNIIPHSGPSNIYTINLTTNGYADVCLYNTTYFPYEYAWEWWEQGYFFNNISIPLFWISLSNNVLKYDQFNNIGLYIEYKGNVSWVAISNTTNYGGPYIGVSFSATVDWSTSESFSQNLLEKLDNPIIYIYYNATVAVVHYWVKATIPRVNITVLEVTWANPNKIGYAVETSNGYTQIEFTNSSSGTTLISSPIQGGNGTVWLFFNLTKSFEALSTSPLGQVYWQNGEFSHNETTTGYIQPPSDDTWNLNMSILYINITNNNNNDELITLIGDMAIDVLLFLATEGLNGAAQVAVGLSSTVLEDAPFIIFQSTPLFEYFLQNTLTLITLSNGQNGHLYVTFSKYSTELSLPVTGYILNYTTYYNKSY